MNEKMQNEIYRRYPRLFRQALAPKGEKGCMAWGLAVGDGWHDLIVRISEAVETLAQQHELTLEQWPLVVEVKEKFGELRFTVRMQPTDEPHLRAVWDEIYRVKEEIASESAHVCERCGAPGVMRKDGWWHVHCDHCESLHLKGLG